MIYYACLFNKGGVPHSKAGYSISLMMKRTLTKQLLGNEVIITVEFRQFSGFLCVQRDEI
jgi:hypothetical protein